MAVPDGPADPADVPHGLSGMIDGDPALGFALYRLMPRYAVLMYVGSSRTMKRSGPRSVPYLTIRTTGSPRPRRTGCGVDPSKARE